MAAIANGRCVMRFIEEQVRDLGLTQDELWFAFTRYLGKRLTSQIQGSLNLRYLIFATSFSGHIATIHWTACVQSL